VVLLGFHSVASRYLTNYLGWHGRWMAAESVRPNICCASQSASSIENADCALLKPVTAAFHMLQVGIGPSMSSACKPWGSSASSCTGYTNRNRL
jgi:hypothetical protein